MSEECIEQYKSKTIDEVDLDLYPVIEENLSVVSNGEINEEKGEV